MKVLIAYDGSEHADAAMEDLHRAGLRDVDALVLSVSEMWVLKSEMLEAGAAERAHKIMQEHFDRAVEKSHAMADRAASRLKEQFPEWRIESEGAAGSAVEAIVRKAESWQADLLVVGPHTHAALLHPYHGGVLLSLLMHAPCSVRVMRQPLKVRESPATRLLVAVDGSQSAQAILNQVRSRAWPSGTFVLVVMVVDARLMPVVIPDLPIGPTSESWAHEIAGKFAEELRNSGLAASESIERGDPRHVLCKVAEGWGTDCIFLGSLGLSRLPWMDLGSTALAVSLRAHCSVEVVRPKGQ
ncbi:MAG: universal stress protein [Tepidisphaeraceae bacterium]|jgi:nucleotide-binding universal stress UspA family protein